MSCRFIYLISLIFMTVALADPASSASGTREDPIPIGTAASLVDGWQFVVLSVNPDATYAINQANQFSVKPQSGNKFVLARIRATYFGKNSSAFAAGYRLMAIGPSSATYSTFKNDAVRIPNAFPNTATYMSGSIEGNICWQVKSFDAGSLVMYDNLTTGTRGDRLYMALYDVDSKQVYSNHGWKYL